VPVGYVGSSLSSPRSWISDTFQYSVAGSLVGWTRQYADRTEQYTSNGYLVRSVDANGNVTSYSPVTYELQAGKVVAVPGPILP
jgi:hypothetical protein